MDVSKDNWKIKLKQGAVLEMAAETLADSGMIMVAGVCGKTEQAISEATLAREFGYHAALLSLTAMGDAQVDKILDHVRLVGEVLPIVGFYLQPAVGGRIFLMNFGVGFQRSKA